MAEPDPVQALELRRRLLRAESELNRLSFRQGLTDLRKQTRWLTEWREAAPASHPFLKVAAPVAGLLAAGTLLRRGTFFGRVSGLLKIAGVVYPLVRKWHQNRKR